MIEDSRYKLWKNLRQRCDNPKHKDWKNYGGRGISYDPAWKDFHHFCQDVGERPLGLTLDRIENDGNYQKGNVKWSSMQEQSKNKRKASARTSFQANSKLGILGVCLDKRRKKYMAYGSVEKKQIQLYKGNSLDDAIAARKAWEFARSQSE